MDIYFLVLSLFFPRIVLLVYFLIERFPPNSVPPLGSLLLGVFIPRALILIFIYQNLGADNIWFIVHLVVMVLTYFTGGRRTNNWRRDRIQRRSEL
jgi:hypothetical protein